MSLAKIKKTESEYKAILELIDESSKIKEDFNQIAIRLEKVIDISVIEKILNKLENFDLFINPFSFPAEEVLEDIKKGDIIVEDIESVLIVYEKNIETPDIGELDYYFLEFEKAIDSLSNLPKSNGNRKINIGVPISEEIETELFVFRPIHKIISLSSISNKKLNAETVKNLEYYLSNCRCNHHFYFNPFSFYLSKSLNTSKEVNIIKRKFYTQILECLSENISDNYFIIKGDINLFIIMEDNFTVENYNKLKDIFLFLVTEQKYTEKYLIIKKVLSLYLQNEDKVGNLDIMLPSIKKTIDNYFDHYVEDNLKDFFNRKDQLLEEAMNASKVIHEQTDKINNSIVASIVSVIFIFLTIFYRSLAALNIVHFIIVIGLFVTFSFLYYHLMSASSKKRYILTKIQFKYFLEEIAILQQSEKNKLYRKFLRKPYYLLLDTLKRLKKILIAMNIFLLITICALAFYEYDIIGWVMNVPSILKDFIICLKEK